jgi:L,D-peptidoglycan transpeptidase YkuD (ErfK/YbiS/YcfS/YnhG family)
MSRASEFAQRLAALAISFGASLPAAAEPACPEPLAKADKLILVLSAGFDSLNANIRLFEKDKTSAWKAVGAARPAVLGKNGLAWSWRFSRHAAGGEPVKTEGDRRTPAGFFTLGEPFGFAADEAVGQVQLKAGEHYCVDDPASAHYNTVVPKATAGRAHGEDMAAVAIYRRGLFIDYPTNREAKGGSCIFVHVWRGSTSGTAGCIAMGERDVEMLQHWSQPRMTAIAILAEDALSRFRGCLPVVDGAAEDKPRKHKE